MQGITRQLFGAFIAVLSLTGRLAAADPPESTAVVISVADQKMALLRDGELLKKYPISTSKFGVGDGHGSYKTPLGKLRVCDKIGEHLAIGAVLNKRHATGEVLPVNAPGRDPIVTRIIWLEGLEAQNDNARGRGIYIHGTNEESKIGQPVSYGCIRMRSKDVVEVFDELPLAASVTIIAEKLPKFQKYAPPKPPIIAAAPPKPPVIAANPPKPPAVAAGPAKQPTPTVVASVTTTRKPAVVSETAPAKSLAAARSEAPHDPLTKQAMNGSILMAGLPDGPKIPTLPRPPEPKDVPRFSPWVSAAASNRAVSLQTTRDLSPAIQAAEAQASAHAAATSTGLDETSSTAPSRRIAFRAGPSEKTHQTP